jgi:hypothetical protein
MVPKAKKEALAPPKTKSKARSSKSKKAVLKDIQTHRKKTLPTFQHSKTLQQPKYPGKSAHREISLTTVPSPSSPPSQP